MICRLSYWSAVVLRLTLYVFLYFSMGLANNGQGLLGKVGGDTSSYVKSIDNLLRYGHYTYSLHYLPAYAGRMPGYGLVYAVLRAVLPEIWALNALVLAQILLALVALYYLGRLTFLLSNSRPAAAAAMLLWAISPFAAQADLTLLTESFAASALIIAIWKLSEGIVQRRMSSMLIAGLLAGWLVFLRPVLAPVPVFWLIACIGYLGRKRRLLLYGKFLLCFLTPLILVETAWTGRNWLLYHRLVPLQSDAWAGNVVPSSYVAAMRYASAVGHEPVPWNMHSIMGWLLSPHAPAHNELLADTWRLVPPASADSLRWLRQQFRQQPITAGFATTPANHRVAACLNRFEQACRSKRPWVYYGTSSIQLFYYLAFAHGASSVFAWPYEQLAPWQQTMRWLFTVWHLLATGLGMAGFVCWRTSHKLVWLVRLPVATLCLVLIFVFRQVESRYFIPVYPLVMLLAATWGTYVYAAFHKWLRSIFHD